MAARSTGPSSKPDHPALVWAPREGDGRRWTYAELLADVHRLAAGLAGRGHRQGRQGAHPLRELPRDGAGVPGLRDARRGRGDHQHQVGRRPRSPTSPSTPARVAAITQPQYAAMVAEAAPGAEVDRGHRRQQRRGRRRADEPRTASTRSTRSSATPPTGTAAPPEPMLPFGIMFTSGTTSRPKAVVHTHANAIWASRTGPRNIDLGHRRPLPDLPAVLPRERAELVAVLGARRRRDRGAHAEVVAEPLLADGRRARRHAHLADAVRDGRARQPRQARRSTRCASACSG